MVIDDTITDYDEISIQLQIEVVNLRGMFCLTQRSDLLIWNNWKSTDWNKTNLGIELQLGIGVKKKYKWQLTIRLIRPPFQGQNTFHLWT